MNLSTDFINNELSFNITNPIKSIFMSSKSIFEDIKNDERFNSQFRYNIEALLLRTTILTHFEKKYLPKNFPFEVAIIQKGYQKIAVITHDHIKLIINAASKGLLPPECSYRLKYSENNPGSKIPYQIEANSKGEFVIESYFGIITYKYKKHKFEHISIVIPDSNYGHVVTDINILDQNSPQLTLLESKSTDIADEYYGDDFILSNENLKTSIKDDIIAKLNS